MSRKVFVSYNFNDRMWAHNIEVLFQRQGTQTRGVPAFVEPNLSMNGDRAIREEIHRVMSGCDRALFVIGNDVHNSPWITWEADVATSLGFPIAAVRIPGTTGGVPPRLAERGIQPVRWDQGEVDRALNSPTSNERSKPT